jgi:hypothetical protein
MLEIVILVARHDARYGSSRSASQSAAAATDPSRGPEHAEPEDRQSSPRAPPCRAQHRVPREFPEAGAGTREVCRPERRRVQPSPAPGVVSPRGTCQTPCTRSASRFEITSPSTHNRLICSPRAAKRYTDNAKKSAIGVSVYTEAFPLFITYVITAGCVHYGVRGSERLVIM